MAKTMSLLEAAKKLKQGGAPREDKNFYYPERDTAKNGTATFRFLPTEDGSLPFVKVYSHSFQGPAGKWFIEECPTTIDEPCYCCEQNSKLYASLTKEEARKFGLNRKVSYIANIEILEDPKTPENEGKVFLYKFGSTVFDMIMDALDPEDENDPKYNVFGVTNDPDYADLPWPAFNLRIRLKDKQTNYDKSKFVEWEGDSDVDLSTLEKLDQFTAESRFKKEAELKSRFKLAMGNTIRNVTGLEDEEGESEGDENGDEQEPAKPSKPAKAESKPAAKPAAKAKAESKAAKPSSADDDNGDDNGGTELDDLMKSIVDEE